MLLILISLHSVLLTAQTDVWHTLLSPAGAMCVLNVFWTQFLNLSDYFPSLVQQHNVSDSKKAKIKTIDLWLQIKMKCKFEAVHLWWQSALMFAVDTGRPWSTLNSASKQNRQGLCSISRDSLALSRKHTSRSSFFRVKRDSTSSWPNQE